MWSPKGYKQKDKIDYNVKFALVARLELIEMCIDFAAYKNFIVYHIYVKSACRLRSSQISVSQATT